MKLNHLEVRSLRRNRREHGSVLTWTAFYVVRAFLWCRGDFINDELANSLAIAVFWGALGTAFAAFIWCMARGL